MLPASRRFVSPLPSSYGYFPHLASPTATQCETRKSGLEPCQDHSLCARAQIGGKSSFKVPLQRHSTASAARSQKRKGRGSVRWQHEDLAGKADGRLNRGQRQSLEPKRVHSLVSSRSQYHPSHSLFLLFLYLEKMGSMGKVDGFFLARCRSALCELFPSGRCNVSRVGTSIEIPSSIAFSACRRPCRTKRSWYDSVV